MNEWIFVMGTLSLMAYCGWKIRQVPGTMNLYWAFAAIGYYSILGVVTLTTGITIPTWATACSIFGGLFIFALSLFYPFIRRSWLAR
jgi:hypothetical protein